MLLWNKFQSSLVHFMLLCVDGYAWTPYIGSRHVSLKANCYLLTDLFGSTQRVNLWPKDNSSGKELYVMILVKAISSYRSQLQNLAKFVELLLSEVCPEIKFSFIKIECNSHSDLFYKIFFVSNKSYFP